MRENFRNLAREALDRASEMTRAGDHGLRYAALELRLAMEALTYDRAEAYRSEIPPEEYLTWQPRKLLALLLEIDPHADASSTLRFGIETEFGERPDEMREIGAEVVLDNSALKKHYDALGSYLHMPTLGQLDQATDSERLARLRSRCAEVAAKLEDVLASGVFNLTFGNFATIQCGRCAKPIRKRIPDAQEREARCFACGAVYTVRENSDRGVTWRPAQEKAVCPGPECDVAVWIWKDEIEVGTRWTCEGCGKKIQIALGLVSVPG
ncbi:MAG: hypothetical protein AAF430_01500 [Myxococcota bacterium]